MAMEIERKFLVRAERLPVLENGIYIEQAYIPTTNGTTVRIRLAGELAFLTIKTKASGFSRREYEYQIPVADAQEILQEACPIGHIEKRRYLIPQDALVWEIDIFGGDNEGLIVAELELESEQQEVELPDWIDREVTLDPRFSNFSLSRVPYKSWPLQEAQAGQ
ncbi:MAG: CYTH domain-containing protein [Gammaproteobacteria bacterium]|nr:CYTH domain-containing protein [Pseudomonadales bacterium]MCP5349119.1 CYTH domain-containing protein [Pseudomonadales bacterium]